MRYFFRLFFLAWLLPLVAACGSEQAAEVQLSKVRVGVLPDQNQDAILARYSPLLDHLSETTGLEFELIVPGSYGELVTMFGEGRVDLAYFGGVTFVKAHHAHGAAPLVMRDVDAKFTSLFLVRAESPASEIRELQDRTFSFGSRLSTSGHLMPRHYLVRQGIEPEAFFGEVLYSGAHDQTAFDVRDGKAELGVANAEVVRAMYADGRLDPEEVRILWETPPYPDYVWALQKNVAETTRRSLRDAFLALSWSDDGHRAILDRMGARAFLPAAMQDFAPLQAIASRLELLS